MPSSITNSRTVVSCLPIIGPLMGFVNYRIYDGGFCHRHPNLAAKYLELDRFNIEADLIELTPEEAAKNAKQKFEMRVSTLLDCMTAAKYGAASSLLTAAGLISLIALRLLTVSNFHLMLISTYGLCAGGYCKDLFALKQTLQNYQAEQKTNPILPPS